MAWIPGFRKCDLCKQPFPDEDAPRDQDAIEQPRPPAFFMLPLTVQELATLAQQVEQLMPPPVREQLGNIIPISLPTHYRLEFCWPCVAGFMPMVDELRQRAIEELIAKYRRRVERQKAKTVVEGSGDE